MKSIAQLFSKANRNGTEAPSAEEGGGGDSSNNDTDPNLKEKLLPTRANTPPINNRKRLWKNYDPQEDPWFYVKRLIDEHPDGTHQCQQCGDIKFVATVQAASRQVGFMVQYRPKNAFTRQTSIFSSDKSNC